MTLPGDIDLKMAWAVFMRNFTAYSRTWKMNLLPNFFEPVVYLLGMGVGLGYYMSGGMETNEYLAFIAPGLAVSAAMNGASLEATYNMYLKMTHTKLYAAYLSTPAQIQDIAFGELVWACARALIYGVAFLSVVGVMTAAGYPIITSPYVVAMPLVLILVGATFALIGQLFTSAIEQMDLYSYYYTLGLTPLFLFSGIFFPVDRFPYGETIAWFTPLFHGVELSHGLCQGPLRWSHLGNAGWMIGVVLLLLVVVPRRLRKRLFH